jgi:hypothetical protein
MAHPEPVLRAGALLIDFVIDARVLALPFRSPPMKTPLIAARVCVSVLLSAAPAGAATIAVASGGNLQQAINGAQPGDTIALQPGATFTGQGHADSIHASTDSVGSDGPFYRAFQRRPANRRPYFFARNFPPLQSL